MEKESELFVSYDQALALKELGYDEPCLAAYINKTLKGCGAILLDVDGYYINSNNETNYLVAAPLKQQVFKWFDDNTFTSKEGKPFQLRGIILHKETGYFGYEIRIWEFDNNIGKWKREMCLKSEQFRTDMESYCIDKLIEILKEKKKEDGKS